MGEVIAFPVSRPSEATQRQPRRPDRGGRDAPEPLWRTAVGDELRAARTERGERLADVASRAGMSPQYLSEIERGRKDPSSEMLAAIAGALGLTVLDLTRRVAERYYVTHEVHCTSSRPAGPTTQPPGPVCLAA